MICVWSTLRRKIFAATEGREHVGAISANALKFSRALAVQRPRSGELKPLELDMTAITEDLTVLVDLASDLMNQDPEALRQSLISALVTRQPIALQAAEVSRAGTATLQLLLAFLREAHEQGVRVELREPSPALKDAIRTLGLERDPLMAAVLS